MKNMPMKKTLAGSWKKMPHSRRQLIVIISLTVLFHALLLVLFRPGSVPAGTVNNKLLTVQNVDLAQTENAPLVQTLQVHDPAMMTQPDRRYGYSAFMNDYRAHPIPEDLPLPPRLIPPTAAPALAALPVRRSVRNDLIPQIADYQIRSLKAAAPAPIGQPAEIRYNGTRFADMEKVLQEFGGSQLEFDAASQVLRTVLFVGPVRLNGELENIQLQQSSGNSVLDQMAVMCVNKYILKYIKYVFI